MEHKRQEDRKDLAGEHPMGDAGQIVFLCLFSTVWIADTFFLKFSTGLNAFVPLAPRILAGALVLALSLALARKGLSIVFGETRERLEVIRKGVFGLVRHPVYLAEILLYLGFLLFSLSLASAAIWVLTVAFLHFIARHEERLLLKRLGGAYRQYMTEVPMWIPRLKRGRGPLT
jgi:protein-S-isoprenylcysteine O-methyltransferase Ste14